MEWIQILIIFSFFSFNFSWKLFHRGRARHGNLGEPFTDIKDLPKEQYFRQKLDHFDPSDTRTWNQRYFVNDIFFKTGGPVFLMIGGEGEASPKWMVDGTWLVYAEKYHAYCVMLEHRFYGKSRPLENLSVKSLSYLSSEQALADLAYFITSFKNEKSDLSFGRWIVMGGSYPGSLAAWMRLKYPHLVFGAISTSGPLLAVPDFKEYFGVVEDSLRSYNKSCVTSIQLGTQQIASLLLHPTGQKAVFKLFKLCDPLEVNNEDDISNLFESLAGNFAGVVQYNKDNRHDKSREVDITIDSVCNIMSDWKLGMESSRLAEVNSLILKNNKQSCLDYKYSKMIKQMSLTDWNSEMAEGARQWTYQTCTEFGFFQTSTLKGTQKMFGDKFPVEFFVKQCVDIFGENFNMSLLTEGVRRTNMMYGGLNDPADNIIYVHGSVDPWHALGITNSTRAGAPAIYIQGTAHCANMYPSSPKDPPQLKNARIEIEKLIGQWLVQ